MPIEDSAEAERLKDVPSVLRRSVDLLRCFDVDADTLSVSELVERSGLPRSSVHRLAMDLVTLGFLTRSSRARYSIGALMFELGHVSLIHSRLRTLAQVHMTRLYDASGENVFLGVLSSDLPEFAAMLNVGQVRGPRSVTTSEREGARSPLLSTALGRALVSVQSDEWVEGFLQKAKRDAAADLANAEDPADAIQFVRENGYAKIFSETTVSLATPIPSSDSAPNAALGIVAARERWDEHRLVPLLKTTALAVAKNIARK
ncbi:IclR family transcriptional regulator [Nesterenkonia lutea]|uniref:DNA-binding IclR family transcriptional regulator n=1 Tax=Nesterenkonia lutea TaxID=272919 RepID=A0ABR9JBS3_9MICC|nr:IclR family transcriptional regulator [Nesterenkonia lutea]MBE1523388.1 DNA-binding IclR family transcriptional regulator [Nesterenkonia lutea]